jgi:hypothetical protein
VNKTHEYLVVILAARQVLWYAVEMPKLLETIRREIERAERLGDTRYKICKRAKVSEAVVSRFMACTRGLSIEVVERLADALELSITVASKTKSR